MSTRNRRPSRPILIADAGFTSQSSQHAKVLERLLDGQLPFRRAGLHALLTLPVGRLGYGQTIDFLAVRNPAPTAESPGMLPPGAFHEAIMPWAEHCARCAGRLPGVHFIAARLVASDPRWPSALEPGA